METFWRQKKFKIQKNIKKDVIDLKYILKNKG